MYLKNVAITFTISRRINASPLTVSSVRILDPTKDISSASITTNTLPTSTTAGTLVFLFIPTEIGRYSFEILASSGAVLLSTFSITAVENSTSYTASISI